MKESRRAYFKSDLKIRSEPDQNDKYVEGYFAVFNQDTELWEGFFEQISPGAFSNSIAAGDVRCLFNHNADIVLGRTKNNTLELSEDAHGLYGKVKINPNDRSAMDAYERVARGDINGCSFGFYPIKEEFSEQGDSTSCTVLEAEIYEVSVCTFPAYPQTEISARQQKFSPAKTKKNAKLELKRKKILNKIRRISR